MTGELIGPATPDMLIFQSVPRVYDPDVDTAEIETIMQSFFPELCYPGESTMMLDFYQRWCGYSISGETKEQKSIFFTGRGSNGKSALGSIHSKIWGDELCRSADMSSFKKGVAGNNDCIYQIRHTRNVFISEGTDDKKMCEELFKKIVGEDTINASAKYITGEAVVFPCKLTFFVNDMPKFENKVFYCSLYIYRLHCD